MKRFKLYVHLYEYDEDGAQTGQYGRDVRADDLFGVLTGGLLAVCQLHTAAKAVEDTTPPRPE